jgi:hypothetical protein
LYASRIALPVLSRRCHGPRLGRTAATGFEFERHVNVVEWDSLEGFFDYFATRFGQLVTAKSMLGERFAALREGILDIWADASEARAGKVDAARSRIGPPAESLR